MILYSWPWEKQCGHRSSCTISSCVRHHHRGCCFHPTQTILKNDAQSPRSDVKGIISLSDVSGMQSPAFTPKRGEITGLCSSSGYRVHDRQTDRHIHRLSNSMTTASQSNRLVCMEWICCYTDGINGVKMWIMLNLPWQQVNTEEVLSFYWQKTTGTAN